MAKLILSNVVQKTNEALAGAQNIVLDGSLKLLTRAAEKFMADVEKITHLDCLVDTMGAEGRFPKGVFHTAAGTYNARTAAMAGYLASLKVSATPGWKVEFAEERLVAFGHYNPLAKGRTTPAGETNDYYVAFDKPTDTYLAAESPMKLYELLLKHYQESGITVLMAKV